MINGGFPGVLRPPPDEHVALLPSLRHNKKSSFYCLSTMLGTLLLSIDVSKIDLWL